MEKLKLKVLSTLKHENSKESEVFEIKEMFESLPSSFSHVKTEFLRQKHFQKSGVFIRPESYSIDIRAE